MPITLSINGQTYNIVFGFSIGVSPPQDRILQITFKRGSTMALLGSVSYASTPLGLTSRMVTVTFDDGSPSVVYDALSPGATFPANDGQTGSITSVAANVIGSAPASDPFAFTAEATITDVPPADIISGVSFVDAGVVASARKRRTR